MREITVKDFLEATKGKQYKVTSEDSKGHFTKINGVDISKSFNMDTVKKILDCGKGKYVLDYGKDVPSYTFTEIESDK